MRRITPEIGSLLDVRFPDAETRKFAIGLLINLPGDLINKYASFMPMLTI